MRIKDIYNLPDPHGAECNWICFSSKIGRKKGHEMIALKTLLTLVAVFILYLWTWGCTPINKLIIKDDQGWAILRPIWSLPEVVG